MASSLGQSATYQSSCTSLVRRPSVKRATSSLSKVRGSSKAPTKLVISRTPPLRSTDEAILITTAFEVSAISPPLKRPLAMVQRPMRSGVDDAHPVSSSTKTRSRQLRHRRSVSRSSRSNLKSTRATGLGIPAQWVADDAASNQIRVDHESVRKRSSHSKTKLPPFRQSRRWTKTYTLCPPKLPPKDPELEPFPTLSLRETSFEQQRAELKPAVFPTQDGLLDGPKENSEASNANCSQGCPRPSSLPCWQAVKVVRILRPNSMPSKWLHRNGSSKSKAARKSREAGKRPSMENMKSTWNFRERSKSRPEKGPNAAAPVTIKHDQKTPETCDRIINLDGIGPVPHLDYRPISPIPSLHDPKKVAGFSQEWKTLVSRNGQLDQSWLVSSASSTGPAEQSGNIEKRNAGPTVPEKDENMTPTSRSSRHASPGSSKGEAGKNVPVVKVTPADRPSAPLQAPIPPIRTSSKGSVEKLTRSLQASRSRSSTPNSMSNSITSTSHGDGNSSTTTSSGREQRRWNKGDLGIPSPHLHVEDPLNSAASVDTLAIIESQFHRGIEASVVQAKKVRATLILPPVKAIGPVGNPPERPLPDLPPTIESDQDSSSSKPTSVRSSPVACNNGSLTHAYSYSSSRSSRSLDTKSPNGRRLMEPLRLVEVDQHGSPKLYTPRSNILSDKEISETPSPEKEMSIARHNVTDLRPERIRSVKRRIKDDIVSDRQRLSSGKPTSPLLPTEDSLPPLPPLPREAELSQRSSLDQLDRFPVAPTSRPGSRASTIRVQSKARTPHAQLASRASMIFSQRNTVHRTPRQVLGPSEIKVLVDTNPVTGVFRTGALSPPPGSIRSQTDSPARSVRGVNTVVFDDYSGTKATPKQKTATRSIKSNSGSRKTPAGTKHTKEKSVGNTSLGGSDYDFGLSPAPLKLSGGKKVRRRWNSNDIQMVQMLWEDLEDYSKTLMKQERELRRQQEEIQMMVRVFAPISRAHGLKQAMFPTEISFDRDMPNTFMDNMTAITQTPRKARKLKTPLSTPPHSMTGSEINARSQSDRSTNSYITTTTTTSRPSTHQTPSYSSVTEPIEYDMDLSPTKSVLRASAAAARSISTPPPTNPTPLLYQSQLDSLSAPYSPSRKSSSSGVLSNIAKPLHKPPPIPTILSPMKYTSPDEATYHNLVSLGAKDTQKGGLAVRELRRKEEEDKENKRLSVNHVLTNIEHMDWVLDQSMFFR